MSWLVNVAGVYKQSELSKGNRDQLRGKSINYLVGCVHNSPQVISQAALGHAIMFIKKNKSDIVNGDETS